MGPLVCPWERLWPGKQLQVVVRIGISVLLLTLLVLQVDVQAMLASLTRINPSLLVLAVLLQLLSMLVAAFRWQLIMQALGIKDRSYGFYLKSYLKGAFFNQGLPTSVGGDAVRILDCTGKGRLEQAVSGVFIDRIVGLSGLLLLNLGALVANPGLLPSRLTLGLLLLVVALLAALVALYGYQALPVRLPRIIDQRLHSFSRRFVQVYGSAGAFWVQTSLTLAVHVLSILVYWVLGRATGLSQGLAVYLTLVPPVVLLTILPVSFAGWGVREGGLMGMFLLVGADRFRVLTMSLAYGLVGLAAALPGLWIYLRQGSRLKG